ncbi:MAG: DUF423 domain-containing protein [Bernardetiaceae bacterium]|nr:DUF423 domain-containing protein [Bernardetiaceae bacterium]
MKAKTILLIACLLGAAAVAIGAFGAHALDEMLRQSGRLETFHTASRYHFYHTFALMGIGFAHWQKQNKLLNLAAWFMLIGTLIFSGTLYLLCLTGITWLGAITPIGGVLLILGWCTTGLSLYRA